MSSVNTFLELPSELVGQCFSHLPYETISAVRSVCHTFDDHCKVILNSGFITASKFHQHLSASIKLQLPRRESERRCHPLSRHTDILGAVETRISLLNMTFYKYIERNACCFIPGKVLDELMSVLRLVKSTAETVTQPPRPHELLQELRDISSMGMEHFEEYIAPNLPERGPSPQISIMDSFCSSDSLDVFTPGRSPSLDVANLRRMFVANKQELSRVKKRLRTQKLQTNRVKAACMKFQRDAIKTNQALSTLSRQYLDVSQKMLELENKIDGTNCASAAVKGQTCEKKITRKRRQAEESEAIRVIPPRKAKKIVQR